MMKHALAALFCAAASVAIAQTTPAPGTDNRALALGDMTKDEVLSALQTDGRVAIRAGFFDTDSAALGDNAYIVLALITEALTELPDARLAVVGHTDSTGPFEHNLALSERRAAALVDALKGPPYRVSPERLVGVGVGSIAPIASNISEEGRALNRRVEFIVVE